MGSTVEQLLGHPSVPQVSYEIDGVTEWAVLLAALCEVIAKLIPSDEVVWNGVDHSTGRVAVYGGHGRYADPQVVQLLLDLEDHPVKAYYLHARPDVTRYPTRLSDLISDREFQRTRTWTELFRAHSVTRQLTIPTGFNNAHTAATAWSMNRSGSDFTDQDVETATALLPLLSAVERSSAWRPDPDDASTFGRWAPWAQRPERAQPVEDGSVGLTPREAQVLGLLAAGLTATAIGHRLRISAATVRKHLEHVYNKIGVHDRLLAVDYARRSGI